MANPLPAKQVISLLLVFPALLLTGGDAGDPAFRRKLSKDLRVEHALSRLTFGARPGDFGAVRKLGLNKWLDQQLHPERIAPDPTLAARLQGLETISLSLEEIAERYPLKAGAAKGAAEVDRVALRELLSSAEIRKLRQGTAAGRRAFLASLDKEKRAAIARALPVAIRRPGAVVAGELVEAKIYRAFYSGRQLEEVLVDFWFNHFNVYLNKGPERLMVTAYERDAIRPHVLGKFGDMLLATARHPAMLFYLDNWQSVDPRAAEAMSRRRRGADAKQPPRRARGLNENYARELLELHTLGVDGGYTQRDVVELARCFTGWTIRDPRRGAGYQFAPRLHDRREKTVLGRKFAAGRGEEDGLEAISLLAAHPATARFISWKLARRFVADEPPRDLVDRLAATFTKTQGDLREVMKTLVTSPEFFSHGAYRAKLKSPFEMAMSAARALNAEVTGALPLAAKIGELGQPLYRKEEPTGYLDTAAEWTNTAGLLGRMNLATALAANQVPGVKVDASLAAAGLMLAAPEFQRR